jgi:type IV pilus assembly protein PilY1
MNNLSLGIAIHSYKHFILYFLIALSLVFTCPLFAKAECSSSIADYIAIPPFMSGGVKGNLLLMLDNSGSMYDLAYVDAQEYCYDDTYNTASVYAGYFDQNDWYYYDQATEQFEPRTGNWASLSSSSEWTTPIGTGYGHDDVHIKVDSDSVTAFFAKGNYLNWATASKLDIQKKILTGGKYEEAGTYGAPNDRLVMESRGCLDRRFVKQVPVTDSNSTTLYLTLAVLPPGERYPVWTNGEPYHVGDIVSDEGELFRATSDGTSSGNSTVDDSGVNWENVTSVFRWTSGTFYPANSIVNYDGKMFITADGGTANGTSIYEDTGIDDWVSYNVTHIEVFPVTETGFDHDDCELAIECLQSDNCSQGALKQYIDGCMVYQTGGGQSEEADSHGAFNHSIHNCWYLDKQGTWPPGAGPAQSVKNDCEHIYDTWGTDPWQITPWDRGYVCYGQWNDNATAPIGYVGRCWNPGANATLECIRRHPQTGECQKMGWVGGTDPGWDAAGYASVDECIEAALQDYCGMLEIPEVIDPSDQASETGEFWNIPAVLIDSAITAQVSEPIAVLKGYIEQTEPPTGIIQEFAEDLRIGAMVFNDYGSKTECNNTVVDPHITYNCSNPDNLDGGKIISYIDDGSALTADGGNHTKELVSEINKIKASCWTPLAEAMYTAIGYYTQNDALRLDPDDFLMDANHTDPVQFWCQTNNVLIITEGASTADRNPDVTAFVAGQNDGDDVDLADCGSLDGSTSLDDLTYYAKHGDIYPAGNKQLNGEDKLNITTHIVAAGTLRSSGAGECSPDVLLEDAAYNGRVLESDPLPERECGPGTGIPCLHQAADPSELERKLKEVFSSIRAGAMAGSAASVISAARAGEGVIYQAIFFPKHSDLSGNEVNWFGEVHALLVDEYGFIREDTNENDTLDNADRFVEFEGETGMAKLYDYDSETGEKTLVQQVEILDLKFLWDTTSWLSDPDMDVLTQRTYASADHKRYIFTDYIDTGADVSMSNVDSTDVMDFTTDFVDDPVHNNYYFLNPYLTYDDDGNPGTPEVGLTEDNMTIEAQNIISFVRGEEGLSETGTGRPYRNRTLDIDDDGTVDTVFRLGDIINSTPTVVSQPSEDYDLLYRDDSYRGFRKKYLNRRIVVYAGANDGMLHAFNGGFYNASAHKFEKQLDGETEFELGSELWAYVPNALLPHLKWLKESLDDNTHTYYLDLKPRIFDARIFYQADGTTPLDDDHPGGWGTVLIGGMRFGGAPIGVDTDGDGTCDLNFRSAYFALDITNPEVAPSLLWSFSDDNLGFTTSYPTPMRVGTKWFIAIGSGPDNYEATRDTAYGGSNRRAKLYILNADNGVLSGNFTMDNHSFMAAPIAVDFDLATTVDGNGDILWTGEAIYVASDGCGA